MNDYGRCEMDHRDGGVCLARLVMVEGNIVCPKPEDHNPLTSWGES